ncbi:MAG TPA: ATP-binding cassette domain-containing protein [Verrucomicrobiae bacterium]|nr:ATP-binding cassette domain-containing protein [Verrucomicrobiae bacterium]
MAPVIEVHDLHYHYEDGTAALCGIDFQLEEGEAIALLGPNGSGKTTFALHLNGLLRGRGSVKVCGLEVNKENAVVIRRKIGLVFQDSDSQLFMPTVIDDVSFGPLNQGLDPREAAERALAALERVGMAAAAGKAPYHLSAGEKKRVAIAGVLAMQPSILVLDEPTTFLDPPAQQTLISVLGGLPQAKVLITHDMSFAQALCARAVFFEKGRIAGEGTVSELVERFGWNGNLRQ